LEKSSSEKGLVAQTITPHLDGVEQYQPGARLQTRVISLILQHIDPIDAGQLRGVSRFAAGIVKLFLLDQYDDAELDRKKVAAMHALFITTPAPAESLDAAEGATRMMSAPSTCSPARSPCWSPARRCRHTPADSGQTYEPFQYRTLL
jgi:capsid protein